LVLKNWSVDNYARAVLPAGATGEFYNLARDRRSGRANHLGGDRTFSRATYESPSTAVAMIKMFRQARADWRSALLSVVESDYDRTGLSSYPYGSDPEETLLSMVWWESQEILHHGAEIALLRDLYGRRTQ
jgi:hypothetical protein